MSSSPPTECISLPPPAGAGVLAWLDLIALLLVVLSALSWAYDALVLRNPISAMLGADKVGASEASKTTARIIYLVVGASAAYLLGRMIYSYMKQRGK